MNCGSLEQFLLSRFTDSGKKVLSEGSLSSEVLLGTSHQLLPKDSRDYKSRLAEVKHSWVLALSSQENPDEFLPDNS